MGFWGSSLYANDCTCDIRDTYIQLLQDQSSNEDAYRTIMESFQEYLGTDEEPLFWYALADTQWRVGRLMPEVQKAALRWLKEEGGMEFWEESKNGGAGWKKTLNKLESRLNTPQPKEKKFADPADVVCNPWNVGDVYAYCFHTAQATEMGYFGKYILMQKLSDETNYKGTTFSHVRVFDKVFDEIPQEPRLQDFRVLPLDPPRRFLPGGPESIRPKLDMSAVLEMRYKQHYPRKYMTYIGTYPVPEKLNMNIRWYRALYWPRIEDTLLSFHSIWQAYDYQLLEDKSIVTIRQTQ